MVLCNKCDKYGMTFERKYSPTEFVEGKLTSKIWIIGLNPKKEISAIDKRTVKKLSVFLDKKDELSYFKDFNKVSNLLYDLLGKENGVCHTDIVKCFSKGFPPKDPNHNDKRLGVKGQREIIRNCSNYLKEQLILHKPRMIICNGSYSCNKIKELVIPNEKQSYDTYYIGKYKDQEIVVVLSGFIGRIDDYSKRRLGKEIEVLIKKYSILNI
ncbi:MAG: uracil-DNA glycosylase family protein [Candidatus Woesearchaeota archaeon]